VALEWLEPLNAEIRDCDALAEEIAHSLGQLEKEHGEREKIDLFLNIYLIYYFLKNIYFQLINLIIY
jgi:hypothetical protein